MYRTVFCKMKTHNKVRTVSLPGTGTAPYLNEKIPLAYRSMKNDLIRALLHHKSDLYFVLITLKIE